MSAGPFNSTTGDVAVDIAQELTLAGVDDVMALSLRMACAAGHHAWVPWLRRDDGSFVTWCVREGCAHSEQYDVPAALGERAPDPGAPT